MVSFWPWRSNDSSTASFEKALSALSTKITATQAQLDRTRSTSRRVKVLWTLYLSFAYLVYAIVLMLVVGWKSMGTWEWTGLSGGPVLIYVTRSALTAFFNFRIDSLSSRLKDQQAERAKTVQRLKDATRYDSTLQLLEKYGGEPKRPKGKKGAEDAEDREEDGEQGKRTRPAGLRTGTPGRTGIAPPPTANIPRNDRMGIPSSAPGTPQPGRSQAQPIPPRGHQREPSAEFAPNAFGPGEPPQPPPSIPSSLYAASTTGSLESHWYDRIMDLLLGEDETAAKNRIVLICSQCRLVNGQAPPSTKSLAELGRWKCLACGAMNGEMDEGKRIIREVLAQDGAASDSTDGEDKATINTDGSSDIVQVEKEEGQTDDGQGAPKARKGKGSKKGKKS